MENAVPFTNEDMASYWDILSVNYFKITMTHDDNAEKKNPQKNVIIEIEKNKK